MNKRLQLFTGHLLVSLVVLSMITFVTLTWWIPKPYMSAEGGWIVLIIFAIIVIVVGPLLTLILYKPGKRGLLLDMVLIGVFQIAIIVFGTYTLYSYRPVFLAFAIDRFVLVSKSDVDMSKLGTDVAAPSFNQKPVLVYARLPESRAGKSQLLQEVMAGKADLEFRPEFYEPIDTNIPDIVSRGIDVKRFSEKKSTVVNAINDFIAQHNTTVEKCIFDPLIGKKKETLLVLNRDDATVVGTVDVNPW